MRVIGVLDLRAGRAVHAVAGRRETYRPVRSALAEGEGDAVALAAAYRRRLALDGLYVADLDAIEIGAPQRVLLRAVAAAFAAVDPEGGAERSHTPGTVLIDAGIATVERARDALEEGATRVVIGLETLDALDGLRPLVDALGASRVTFSLDLRDGRPLARAAADRQARPIELVERAALAGVGSIIVLDLARVGTGAGVDAGLLGAVRREFPSLELLAGGGVRDRRDLERLADVGADGALVATALHDERLTAADVEAVRAARRDP